MTIRERMMAVYRNRKPDRVPLGIYNRYHRIGKSERIARNAGMGILDFYPVISLLAPPWHMHAGYLSEVKNCSFRIKYAWENSNLVEERIIETPVGTLTQQIIKDPSYGSDWVQKHYIQSGEDYKIMTYVIENSLLISNEKAVEQRIGDLGEDGVVLGRVDRSPYQKLLIELADPEHFLVDLITDPAPVETLMEAIDFRLDEQFDRAMNSDVEVIWQPDNITTDMTPPDMFSKYCLPFYTKNGKKCREAGKVYAIHIDGKAGKLQEYLKQAPFDIVESFSVPMMGGDMEVEEALEIWPDKVICPNFPASLCTAEESEIVSFLNELNESFNGRPYMVQLSEDFNLDKYDHVLQILAKHFGK
ncbi:MAG: uroporphyrinogen decarboxylase family protein [Bacteroidota bacterium]